MGFLGADAQGGQVSFQNSLDFMPIFNIGDSNSNDTQKTSEQATEQSAKLDSSFGVSASVGVGVGGGSGSGGEVTSTKGDDSSSPQPTTAYNAPQSSFNPFSSNNGNSSLDTSSMLTYGAIALVGIGGVFYLKKKKVF